LHGDDGHARQRQGGAGIVISAEHNAIDQPQPQQGDRNIGVNIGSIGSASGGDSATSRPRCAICKDTILIVQRYGVAKWESKVVSDLFTLSENNDGMHRTGDRASILVV
jgi:hypothetical protein